jgi:hypothetical protein
LAHLLFRGQDGTSWGHFVNAKFPGVQTPHMNCISRLYFRHNVSSYRYLFKKPLAS